MDPIEKAILICANEDYCSLGQAELEARAAAGAAVVESVVGLVQGGYLYLSEIEQSATGTKELRRLDVDEAVRVLRAADSWTPPLAQGERFFALSPTVKGTEAFKEALRGTGEGPS